MNDLKFACPHCNQPLEVPEELLGQVLECPSCKNQIQTPQRASLAKPAHGMNGWLIALIVCVCLACILYIGSFSAGVISNVTGHNKESRITATRTTIAEIEKAAQIYAMKHNGKFPDAIEDLTSGTADKPGLLKEGDSKDAWGTAFVFLKIGKRIIISSAGPDGEFGNEDDLQNY